ncbi:Transcriptional regulator/sugar kinase (plasmid) [Rubrobacter radiotolerans]|uniref:ROK family protein n=1 Tax=Rubrobacter radiotolerans TaxID=42256 RepID=A0A023X8G0_RUBRA|nr:ROK family protein [Rubrobacter radiotolerans]AHY48330.1 Transcriptional regulator/sugar kinase [Rubrobacter radiotolerans]MDX5895466.1 ROK family protein [Rubrobacter radiotolerans]SMC01527.1 glucokinase [Rubrobacter radiotolerans DSM 5868]
MNAIGVDVGGTKIAAAVVSPEGEILNEVRYPTQAIPPNRLVRTIADTITEAKGDFEVGGACVAAPGFVSSAENKVIFAPNLHEIEDIRLDRELGSATGLRITVENDANAAAWGEFRFGAGREFDHQVFITLGTGVGGGVITHGVLLRGAQGAGGELGHVTIDPDGPRCGCGNHGCLEALASGTAIGRRAREVANERPRSALGRLAIDRQVLGEDVTRLASEGDEAALQVLDETGRWLGIGLAGFVNVFNPEVVAVGGGAARAGEFILEPARREVHLRARSPSRDLVRIKEATLGPASGVLGAAALARGEDGEYVLGPSKRVT